MIDRKSTLLRAAYDLLSRMNRSNHSDALATLAHYDEADCDGLCLIDDIATELGLERGEAPIPTDDPCNR